jgi:RNA polymerase sigma factor (sigma-70 family)
MSKLTDFFRRERLRLVRYVRSLIEDAGDRDAEDIVQDVMLSIFDKADVTIPIENLAAYVYQSLRNKVVDIFRKKKDVVSLEEVVYEAGCDPARAVEKEELVEHIFSAMDFLPPEQRAVLIATEFEGRSYRELSEEWNVPMGTLLARKSRALNKIKQELIGLV